MASAVVKSFYFTLQVLPNLGEEVHRKGKLKGSTEDNRIMFFSRNGLIEFTMSFLEVSTLSLSIWVL